MSKSKVKLSICGSDYVIVSDDSESYVRAVGDKVNDKMSDILSKNPKLSISMSAVLSALEFCDELFKTNDKNESFRSQIKDYVAEVSKYRDKNESFEIEINKLKNKVESLNNLVNQYKKEIDQLNEEKSSADANQNMEHEIVTLSLLKNEIADSI